MCNTNSTEALRIFDSELNNSESSTNARKSVESMKVFPLNIDLRKFDEPLWFHCCRHIPM